MRIVPCWWCANCRDTAGAADGLNRKQNIPSKVMKNPAREKLREPKATKRVRPKALSVLRKTAPRPPKRILVPTDFSKGSSHALDYAVSFAKQFQSHLVLIHVVEAFPIDYLLGLKWSEEANQWLMKQLRERLGDVARRLTGARLGRGSVETMVTFGKPFQQIAKAAQARSVDLIILATHGYTGLKHIQLGSTAERVVRYAPCPVLVVRAKASSSAGVRSASVTKTKVKVERLNLRRILIPVDFSPRATEALRYAVPIARRFHARIILLHVVHTNYFVTSDEYLAFDYPALISEMQGTAKKELAMLADSVSKWCGVTTAMETGHPGNLIVETSSKQNIDLIIMSTHGRTGIKRALLGSTAEFVVRHAHCTVLAVRDRKRSLTSAKIAFGEKS